MVLLAQRENSGVLDEPLSKVLPFRDSFRLAHARGERDLEEALDVGQGRLKGELVVQGVLQALLDLHLRTVEVRITAHQVLVEQLVVIRGVFCLLSKSGRSHVIQTWQAFIRVAILGRGSDTGELRRGLLMHFATVVLLELGRAEDVGNGCGEAGVIGCDMGLIRRWDLDAEERQLVADRQGLQHVVLGDGLDREAEHGDQEQAIKHGALHECGGGLVKSKVTVQEVHTLAEHPLLEVIREDEDLGQQRMLVDLVEGHKQVSMALVQLAHISSIRRT